MDNNNKLQAQVDKLEKLVEHLTRRVSALEQDNKKLRSRVIVQTSELSNLKAALQRRGL